MTGSLFVCLMGLSTVFLGLLGLMAVTRLVRLFAPKPVQNPPVATKDAYAPALAAILCALETELGPGNGFEIQSIQQVSNK